VRLTKTVLDRARYQGTGNSRHVLWDGALPGFGLRIFPSGRKSFVVFYRTGSRQRLMTIGRYGLYTLQQARLKARKILTRVADGEDPLAERRKDRRAITLNQLWQRYLEEWARPRKKLRSIRDELGVWGRYLARGFGPRLLSQVTRQDVARLGCLKERHVRLEREAFIGLRSIRQWAGPPMWMSLRAVSKPPATSYRR